jgi:scyllo-inositol 2-dehydrogenase (NAD+)
MPAAMAARVRCAVVGCGRMGAFPSEAMRRFAPRCWFPLSHAEAIRRHPDLELSALCDLNALSLERAAQLHGVGATYSDYRRLIEEVRPQLLGIATRTVGRAQIIRDAADHGVRALHIEKPLCNSARELAELTRTFARTDLYCTYGAIRRYFRIYQSARSLALSGAYGSLREIRVNMGRGTLYWTHPHSVDLILFVAGERPVEAVQARLAGVVHGASRVEITSDPYVESASIYFGGGVAGHITQAPGCDLLLSCSEGEIAVESDGRGIRIAAHRGEDPYLSREPYAEAPAAEAPEGSFAPISQLARCLAGEPGQAQLNQRCKAHILQGQNLLFAMVQSHLENSRLTEPAAVDPAITVHAKTGENFA